MSKYETERLILREIQLDDAALVEKYASDVELAKTTLNIPSPYPKGSGRDFLAHTIESQKAGKLRNLAVVLKETNAFIGLMSIGINNTFKRGNSVIGSASLFGGKDMEQKRQGRCWKLALPN